MKKGDIVTVDLNGSTASNTYIIKQLLDNNKCLLYHPIFKDCFIMRDLSELNHSASIIKDSTERSLDFAIANKRLLGYNTVEDLSSLCLVFSIKRKLTPRQKNILSMICGNIAAIHFNNNIDFAIDFVIKNEGLLDDFNRMWYHNFSKLFARTLQITSKKQRTSILNIAGFLLAELENPVTKV